MDSIDDSAYIQSFGPDVKGEGDLYEMIVDATVASKVGSCRDAYPYCAVDGVLIGLSGDTYAEVFSLPKSSPKVSE